MLDNIKMLYRQSRNGIDYFEINKTPNITAISGCNIGRKCCNCLSIKPTGRKVETPIYPKLL